MSRRSLIGVVALLATTIACHAQQGGSLPRRRGRGTSENATSFDT